MFSAFRKMPITTTDKAPPNGQLKLTALQSLGLHFGCCAPGKPRACLTGRSLTVC